MQRMKMGVQLLLSPLAPSLFLYSYSCLRGLNILPSACSIHAWLDFNWGPKFCVQWLLGTHPPIFLILNPPRRLLKWSFEVLAEQRDTMRKEQDFLLVASSHSWPGIGSKVQGIPHTWKSPPHLLASASDTPTHPSRPSPSPHSLVRRTDCYSFLWWSLPFF